MNLQITDAMNMAITLKIMKGDAAFHKPVLAGGKPQISLDDWKSSFIEGPVYMGKVVPGTRVWARQLFIRFFINRSERLHDQITTSLGEEGDRVTRLTR